MPDRGYGKYQQNQTGKHDQQADADRLADAISMDKITRQRIGQAQHDERDGLRERRRAAVPVHGFDHDREHHRIGEIDKTGGCKLDEEEQPDIGPAIEFAGRMPCLRGCRQNALLFRLIPAACEQLTAMSVAINIAICGRSCSRFLLWRGKGKWSGPPRR